MITRAFRFRSRTDFFATTMNIVSTNRALKKILLWSLGVFVPWLDISSGGAVR